MAQPRLALMIATAGLALSACGAIADEGPASVDISDISSLVETLNDRCDNLDDKDNSDACINFYRDTVSSINETLIASFIDPNNPRQRFDTSSLQERVADACETTFQQMAERPEEGPYYDMAQAIVTCNAATSQIFSRANRNLSEEETATLESQIAVLGQLPDCYAPISFEANQAAFEARANGEEAPPLVCGFTEPSN